MGEKNSGQKCLTIDFAVKGMDFTTAGEAAARIKAVLQQIGMAPEIIRRVVIVAYEAELNIVIHAYSGFLKANITADSIELIAQDEGPGIPDIPLAMQEGYSTAPQHVREMGFGAGMGLPNIKKCADKLDVQSKVGEGTTVRAVIYNK
ncbi:MAG: ATP-binding protein [Firmicutes bacterium]|nr:ATP-binding protein [Bacillota bacterium]